MIPIARCLLLLLFIIIGIIFAIGFGAIFYKIRKDKDNQISIGGIIKSIIIPSIFFWVTIGILIILKIEYSIPLHLFILSGIILASFLSAISIKNAKIFFLGLSVVIVELGLVGLIRKISELIKPKNTDKIIQSSENNEKKTS
jgi:hypothetical protein